MSEVSFIELEKEIDDNIQKELEDSYLNKLKDFFIKKRYFKIEKDNKSLLVREYNKSLICLTLNISIENDDYYYYFDLCTIDDDKEIQVRMILPLSKVYLEDRDLILNCLSKTIDIIKNLK